MKLSEARPELERLEALARVLRSDLEWYDDPIARRNRLRRMYREHHDWMSTYVDRLQRLRHLRDSSGEIEQGLLDRIEELALEIKIADNRAKIERMLALQSQVNKITGHAGHAELRIANAKLWAERRAEVAMLRRALQAELESVRRQRNSVELARSIELCEMAIEAQRKTFALALDRFLNVEEYLFDTLDRLAVLRPQVKSLEESDRINRHEELRRQFDALTADLPDDVKAYVLEEFQKQHGVIS